MGTLITAVLAAAGFLPAHAPRSFTAGTHPAYLAFSSDGKTLAVASGDAIHFHDPTTGKKRRSLTEHTWPIRTVSLAPDGKLLASGAGGFQDGKRRGEVLLWDVGTGKVTQALEWWDSDVQAVAFAPDGKSLAAGGLQGLRVWDAASGKLVKEVKTTGAILALAYSSDGKRLAAGLFTEMIHVWDTETWKAKVLKGHKSGVRALAYSPNGQTLVSGGVGEFKVWDGSGELRRTVKHPDTVWAVAFTGDGKWLAIGSGQPRADLKGAVRLFDCADWTEKHRWSSDGGMVGSVVLSPDGKLLASGRFTGVVEVRDVPIK